MKPCGAYITERSCTGWAGRDRQHYHLGLGATSHLIIHFWLLKVAVPLLLFLPLSVPFPLPISFSLTLSVPVSVSIPITLPFPISFPLLVPRCLGCGGHIISNVFKYTRKTEISCQNHTQLIPLSLAISLDSHNKALPPTKKCWRQEAHTPSLPQIRWWARIHTSCQPQGVSSLPVSLKCEERKRPINSHSASPCSPTLNALLNTCLEGGTTNATHTCPSHASELTTARHTETGCKHLLARAPLLSFSSVPQEPPDVLETEAPGDLGSILKRPSRGKVSLPNPSVTFILLLELLVASTLPQVGKNLGELADDNVICSKRGLSLKTPRSKNVIPLSRNLFTFSFTH